MKNRIVCVGAAFFTVCLLSITLVAGTGGDSFVAATPDKGSGVLIVEAVVFATNSIHFTNRVQVISGFVVANDASPGPTLAADQELTVGPKSTVSAQSQLMADGIRLNKGAVVDGDVYYNELTGKGTVNGTLVTPVDLPVITRLANFEDANPGAEDVFVADGGSLTLDAGSYAELVVGTNATLVFTGGAYDFASINSGPFSNLYFDAPSKVRVAGKIRCENSSYVGPGIGSGVVASEIAFFGAGINGLDGALESAPKAAQLGPSGQIFANFYVPFGTIFLQPKTSATGAFLGKDVMVGSQSDLTLDSYFYNRPPEAADDSFTVQGGGSASVLDSGETSLLANDGDPDGDTLTVTTTPVSGPSHGVLTLNADGTFEYTHIGGDTGPTDSFVYEVCDDGAPQLCDTATVNITVIKPQRLMRVRVIGDGNGTVTSTPAGIDCGVDCAAYFDDGEVVTLDAVPEPDAEFVGWGGDSDCYDGQVLMTDFTYCYAYFELKEPPPPIETGVTIVKQGDGDGLVYSEPQKIMCGVTCQADFPEHTRVIFYVVTNSDSRFLGFSGPEDCLDGMISVTEDDITCYATFELLPPPPPSHTLEVVLQGDGGGTITSNPIGGILCPGECSHDYEIGSIVNLRARPDDSFSYFAGFSGDPDCADGWVTLDAPKTCIATFNKY